MSRTEEKTECLACRYGDQMFAGVSNETGGGWGWNQRRHERMGAT